ncbi:hypothetical protein MKX08_004293 [Trichoderma sp. CBMAI-0020]|nr:hypothetical protein MKX08_004293 [Trichoderma sp. CBMAI-0020]
MESSNASPATPLSAISAQTLLSSPASPPSSHRSAPTRPYQSSSTSSPKNSWHMTVLGGIHGDKVTLGKRAPEFEGQSLEAVTEGFSQKLRQLGLELEQQGLAPPYKMRIRRFNGAKFFIGLQVEGATAEEEKRVRLLRDRLADALGLRLPNDDTYGSHITVAYLMRYIEGKDRKMLNALFEKHLSEVQLKFELGAVEFCTYENMYAFARLFCLGESQD